MAGKGEFLLHGLIGGASGAIAALVNMYVQFTSFHKSLLFTSLRHPSSARVSRSLPNSAEENKLITAHQKPTSHSTKHSMKATTKEQNNFKTS
jgi:hypothetical protein